MGISSFRNKFLIFICLLICLEIINSTIFPVINNSIFNLPFHISFVLFFILFFERTLQELLTENSLKEIDQILFFIHSEELNFKNEYFLEVSDNENIIYFKEDLQQSLQKYKIDIALKIFVYKHEVNHFWGRILLKVPQSKPKNLNWSEYIANLYQLLVKSEEEKWNEFALSRFTNICKKVPFNISIKYAFGDLIEDTPPENSVYSKFYFSLPSKPKSPNIRITFAHYNYLTSRVKGDQIIEELILDQNPIPHIIVGSRSIFLKPEKRDENFEQLGFQDMLDQRYRFFDSSIWVRYVALETNELGERFEDQLTRIMKEFKIYYDQGLYFSNVAKEFLEYNCRLFQNSYLKEFNGGGHASDIIPFIFHSETLMDETAQKLEEEFSHFNLSWDILLIDDFAEKTLRSNIPNQNISNKKNIIQNLVKRASISAVSSIEQGCTSIEQGDKTYDIILLDYLFSDTHNKAKYGTHLLELIDNNSIVKGKAINYKYWIFPVSVFSDALHSALEEKGIQYLEKHWVLSRGADPIATPQLFKASLLAFMKLQLENLFFKQEDIIRLWLQYPIQENNSKSLDIRPWAKRFHYVLQSNYGKRKTLHFNSSFSRSVKESLNKNNTESISAFSTLEKLEHLLDIVAFSPTYDIGSAAKNYKHLKNSIISKSLEISNEEREAFGKQFKLFGEGIFAIHNEYSS